jgi:alpha-L-arabinofuranosidase
MNTSLKNLFVFVSTLFLSSLLLSCAGAPVRTTAAPIEITIHAEKTVRAIPPELFGQNMAVWEKSATGADAEYNAAVKAIQPAVIRFPGGGYADMVDWENIPQCKLSWVPITMEKGIAFADACGAQLQIIVNYAGNWCDRDQGHAAAVKKAADWVRYMNVTGGGKHYVKYWEIGNETFGSGENGYWDDDEDGGRRYGKNFVDFYKEMKKTDPKIQIGAQCQFDHYAFSKGALQEIKKAGVIPDFLIAHVYPIWLTNRDKGKGADNGLYASNPVLDGRITDNVAQAESVTAVTDGLVSKYLGKKYAGKIPYWCTEWRSVLEFKYDEFVDTIFCSQFLLELGRLGWRGANIWDLKNGFDVKKGEDYGLLRTGVNANISDDNPINSPRPTYYIYPFLSRVFGKQLIDCSAPEYVPNAVLENSWKLNAGTGNRVRAWASKDASGNLTIFAVNNDWNADASANINITGFNAGAEGREWLFESSGNTYYGKDTPIAQRYHLKINGNEDPAIASLPGDGNPIRTGNTFTLDMPALSMALVRIPAGVTSTAAESPAK